LIKNLKNKKQRTKRLKKGTRPRKSRDAWVWGLPTWLGRYFYVFTRSKWPVLFSHFFFGKNKRIRAVAEAGAQPLQGKFSPAPPFKQSLKKKIPPIILFNLIPLLIFFSCSSPELQDVYHLKSNIAPRSSNPWRNIHLNQIL
jgi:hypothetical protein